MKILLLLFLGFFLLQAVRCRDGNRILLATLLAWLAVDPGWTVHRFVPPRLTVLVDDSKSMERPLFESDSTPVLQAVELTKRLPKLLGTDRYRIDVHRLSEIVPGTSPLGTAVKTLERQAPDAAALLLLSDGIGVDGPPLERIQTLPVPIYAVGFGATAPVPDLRWRTTDLSRTTFPGEPIRLTPVLEAVGFTTPIDVDVQLDELFSGAKIQAVLSRKIKIDPSTESSPVPLEWNVSEPGEHRFRLSVGKQPNEWIDANNRVEFSVVVEKEKIRVLLLDQTPRFEYRFLRELFRREPGFDLKTILLEADPRYVEQDPVALQPDAVDVSRFDVVIVGDIDPNSRIFMQLRQQWDAADAPQGLVHLPGRRFGMKGFEATPWTVGTDFTESTQPMIFRFTSETFGSLPPIFQAIQPQESAPAIQILAVTENDLPLIALRSLGRTTLLWCGTDELWRLRSVDGGTVYRDFWIRNVRTLAGKTSNPNEYQHVQPLRDASEKEFNRLVRNDDGMKKTAVAYEPFSESGVRKVLDQLPPGKPEIAETKRYPFIPRPLLFAAILGILVLMMINRKGRGYGIDV